MLFFCRRSWLSAGTTDFLLSPFAPEILSFAGGTRCKAWLARSVIVTVSGVSSAACVDDASCFFNLAAGR